MHAVASWASFKPGVSSFVQVSEVGVNARAFGPTNAAGGSFIPYPKALAPRGILLNFQLLPRNLCLPLD